jgi:cation transport protein ChaC
MLRLFRRELLFRPSAHVPRWLKVATESGPLDALAFVIDRNGGRYVGGLSDDEVADALATAVGHRGSMAEYLHNTVRHLEELGLRDGHLWRLQEMVAERIEAARSIGQAGNASRQGEDDRQ